MLMWRMATGAGSRIGAGDATTARRRTSSRRGNLSQRTPAEPAHNFCARAGFADLAMIVKPMAGKPTVVLIPARLRSTRLPDKPLAEIGGVPMIVHVWRRACEAAVGPVVVACAEPAIAEAVAAHGGESVLTDPDLPSGTDRIFQALGRIDPAAALCARDQPARRSADPGADGDPSVLQPLEQLGTDMGTLAVATEDPLEKADPNVVKAIIAFDPARRHLGRALYFTRATAPSGDGPVYHHIGIYAFSRDALERFATLPPSPLEQRERLEQLRALEAGLSIGVALVDTNPLGVDTPDDLERARKELAARAV